MFSNNYVHSQFFSIMTFKLEPQYSVNKYLLCAQFWGCQNELNMTPLLSTSFLVEDRHRANGYKV